MATKTYCEISDLAVLRAVLEHKLDGAAASRIALEVKGTTREWNDTPLNFSVEPTGDAGDRILYLYAGDTQVGMVAASSFQGAKLLDEHDPAQLWITLAHRTTLRVLAPLTM